MITRIWHGAILATKSDEYLNLMRTPSRSPITARPPATRGLMVGARRQEMSLCDADVDTPGMIRSVKKLEVTLW